MDLCNLLLPLLLLSVVYSHNLLGSQIEGTHTIHRTMRQAVTLELKCCGNKNMITEDLLDALYKCPEYIETKPKTEEEWMNQTHCIFFCISREAGLAYGNGDIAEEEFKAFALNSFDDELSDNVDNAVMKCLDDVRVLDKQPSYTTCKVPPAYVIACVLKEVFNECPEELSKTIKSKPCTAARALSTVIVDAYNVIHD